MCIVSAIFDYGRNVPPERWSIPAIQDFEKLVRQGQEFDKEAGEPDCEDPTKAELLKELKAIKKRLRKLEKKNKKSKTVDAGE